MAIDIPFKRGRKKIVGYFGTDLEKSVFKP
jgi:hypothetical protein